MARWYSREARSKSFCEKYAPPRLLWKLALSSLSLMAFLYSLMAALYFLRL
jgi:hypothetical protein